MPFSSPYLRPSLCSSPNPLTCTPNLPNGPYFPPPFSHTFPDSNYLPCRVVLALSLVSVMAALFLRSLILSVLRLIGATSNPTTRPAPSWSQLAFSALFIHPNPRHGLPFSLVSKYLQQPLSEGETLVGNTAYPAKAPADNVTHTRTSNARIRRTASSRRQGRWNPGHNDHCRPATPFSWLQRPQNSHLGEPGSIPGGAHLLTSITLIGSQDLAQIYSLTHGAGCSVPANVDPGGRVSDLPGTQVGRPKRQVVVTSVSYSPLLPPCAYNFGYECPYGGYFLTRETSAKVPLNCMLAPQAVRLHIGKTSPRAALHPERSAVDVHDHRELRDHRNSKHKAGSGPLVVYLRATQVFPDISQQFTKNKWSACGCLMGNSWSARHQPTVYSEVVRLWLTYGELWFGQISADTTFVCGNRAGRCRWSVGFLTDLLFPPLLLSSAAPYSSRFTLKGSQALGVKSHTNLFTRSLSIPPTRTYFVQKGETLRTTQAGAAHASSSLCARY
ncbi:hypothetical protein PR048_000422 [Dryococelus australis]|uniref:Uncharacterized protein n=1 Tax=Dryococelus australis TaxID=614101 RepID=A0ABQ9IEJ9_9NEOP|nr:hypothetical protein PR048_000422 [Dryococelus australis]